MFSRALEWLTAGCKSLAYRISELCLCKLILSGKLTWSRTILNFETLFPLVTTNFKVLPSGSLVVCCNTPSLINLCFVYYYIAEIIIEKEHAYMNYYWKRTCGAWFHYGLGGRTKGRSNLQVCKDIILIDRCGLTKWGRIPAWDMCWPSVALMANDVFIII